MMNKTGFIGAGKVGTAFGNYLKKRGISLLGYYSRTRKHAEESAAYTGSRVYDSAGALIADCDMVFITVADGAIEDVAQSIAALDMRLECKTFCHTSGALSSGALNVLKDRGADTASAHMLLAVSDRNCDFSDAFFTLEGDCGKAAALLDICGNKYKIIKPDNKALYHAAAVFVSNFAVGLSDIACELLGGCGFSDTEALAALSPLIKNNAENITQKGPKAALTGPVERGDFDTVRRHLECLSGEPLAKEVYEVMTKVLIKMIDKGEIS